MAYDGTQLVINEWRKGIGESSSEGFAEMRNVDILSKPGYLLCGEKMYNLADVQGSATFTVNTGTDEITTASSLARIDDSLLNKAFYFTTTGTLPAGLSLNTVYWVRANTSTTVFTLKATFNPGDLVDITNSGSGVHTIHTYDLIAPKYAIYNFGNQFAPAQGAFYIQDYVGNIWCIGFKPAGGTISNFPICVALGDTNLAHIGSSTLQKYGAGLVFYHGYLFFFLNVSGGSDSNRTINYIVSPSFSPVVTYGWQTALYGFNYQNTGANPYHASNDTVYFNDKSTHGSYSDALGGWYQKAGQIFDPSDTATYTYGAGTSNLLDLPIDENITAISQLGNNLMIATSIGKIYPWDTISASFSTPIETGVLGIACMKTINSTLYFSGGSTGRVYMTNNVSTYELFKLPKEYLNYPYNNTVITAMEKYENGIVFLVRQEQQNSNSIYSGGVYYYDFTEKTFTELYKPSAGYGTSSTNNFFPYQCLAVSDGDWIPDISLYSSKTYGVYNSRNKILFGYTMDRNITNEYSYSAQGYLDSQLFYPQMIDNYNAYVVSPLYTVGTFDSPKTFQSIQIFLNKPLTTGQGIRVSYRKNRVDSFSGATTFDTSSDLGTTNLTSKQPVNMENCQYLQLKIELTANTTAFGTINYDTPELEKIIIY